jgi:hypothetical protein
LEETVKELREEVGKRSGLIRELNQKVDQMISVRDY